MSPQGGKTKTNKTTKKPTVTELYKEFLELEKRIKRELREIKLTIHDLQQSHNKLLKRYAKLVRILGEKGILTAPHKILLGHNVNIYFWVTKNEYKVVRKEGLKRRPFIGAGKEWKAFHEIVSKRGYDIGNKAVLGFLTPKPHMSPQVMYEHICLKTFIDARFVYVGDYEIYNLYTMETDPKERIELVKKFAESIMPLVKIAEAKEEALEHLMALVMIDIPPDMLHLTTEYLRYMKYGAIDSFAVLEQNRNEPIRAFMFGSTDTLGAPMAVLSTPVFVYEINSKVDTILSSSERVGRLARYVVGNRGAVLDGYRHPKYGVLLLYRERNMFGERAYVLRPIRNELPRVKLYKR